MKIITVIIICCMYGNCTCNSLDHALVNLTSNILINITNDVTLSLLIERSYLQHVSIIGCNNPTVNCKAGGMRLTYCHNWIIQGITWDGCGTEISDHLTEPVIKLNYSTNVTIRNCNFQYSIGQVLVLSEVSGDIDINNCNFVNNSHYRGHGAAIHYSYMYNVNKFFQFVFTINNCNFTNNKHTKSLVYIENKSDKYHSIIFNSSNFCRNQGPSVYVINHKIYINGKVLFQSNVAEDGAGIDISDHSTVIFGENSNVTFSQNSVHHRGGAIFITNHSACVFHYNSVVVFYYNKATKGGAIYSEASCNIAFNAFCKATFNNNLATQYGAAIFSLDYSQVTFTGNARVSFYSNVVQIKNSSFGGIIHSCNNCVISFEDKATTVFRSNTAENGGVLYISDGCYISFEGNSATKFINNTADVGGAILSFDNSYISLKRNSATEFSNNTAKLGGAIYTNKYSGISFEGNSTTEFSNNTAADYGGAILSSYNSYISLEGNSTTQFCNNTANDGGAMFSAADCRVSFNGYSTAEFSNNAANLGGAIVSCYDSYISLEGSSTAVFSNNIAKHGGAIYSKDNCSISI